MTKNRFDNRTLLSVIESLKIERTIEGDYVKMVVKRNGLNKPTITLEFITYSREKIDYPKQEEITDWLPDSYSESVKDAISGEHYYNTISFSGWSEYLESYLVPTIQGIIVSGGRNFSMEVI